MSEAWSDAWHSVVTFLPKLAAFLIILVAGWFIAKLVGKVVDTILERLHFDRAVERGGIKKALAASQYDASTIVGKLVFYTLVLFVLQLAFGVFGPNPISELLTGVIAFLPKVLVAIVIVVITAAIAAAVRELVTNTLGGLSYGRTLANIAAAFIIGIGVIAALNQVGIATTVTTPILIAVLTAIVGVIVVGVGGGLIKPMQARWEGYLTKAEQEAPRIREEAANATVAQQEQMAFASPEPAYAVDAHYSAPTETFEAVHDGASHRTSDSYTSGAEASDTHASPSYASDSYRHDADYAGSHRDDSHPDDSHRDGSNRDGSNRDDSDAYAAERRDADTHAFERPPVDTQIFGDDERGRSVY